MVAAPKLLNAGKMGRRLVVPPVPYLRDSRAIVTSLINLASSKKGTVAA